MSNAIIGRYYSAQQGLFPALLPDTWFLRKHDGTFRMESWGRENTEQAIAWLDEKEAERLARIASREQDFLDVDVKPSA